MTPLTPRLFRIVNLNAWNGRKIDIWAPDIDKAVAWYMHEFYGEGYVAECSDNFLATMRVYQLNTYDPPDQFGYKVERTVTYNIRLEHSP